VKRASGIIVFVLLHLGSGTYSMAQTRNTSYDKQWWLRYYSRLEFSDKWNLITEIDNRRFFQPDRQNTFLVRMQLHFNFIRKVSLGGGVSYFVQNQNLGESGFLSVPEIRPHQELNIKQSIGKINISHRYKIEERFIRNMQAGKLADGYRFNFRFRYQLGLDIMIAKKLKLRVFNEILLNAGKSIQYNFFDQNRIYGGLQYELIKNLSVEAGYMYWFQQRSSGKDFYSWDILRFTIYHTVAFSKKEKTNVTS